MTAFIFWSCLALIAYSYIGYALALAIVARLRARPVARRHVTPPLSLIITVRNEEARIAQKLEECVNLLYPASALEVIVASDASTDRTHEIVRRYADRGVLLVVSSEREGKEASQRLAIGVARGELLVFSDVATRMDPDGLLQLAMNFADPTVGCVSSEDRVLRGDGSTGGEGLYVRYEMWLRSLESAVGSVVGLSGSLFAARREVCSEWTVDLPSDFTTLLSTLKRGMRGISDPHCIGYYQDLSDPAQEYRRKVRTITRGIASLLRNLDVMNPFRFGFSAWQLFSHKLCRWLVPFALAGTAISNAVLVFDSAFYKVAGALQALAYGIGIVGALGFSGSHAIPRVFGFFLLANLAILSAWLNIASGRQFVVWEPSKRPDG